MIAIFKKVIFLFLTLVNLSSYSNTLEIEDTKKFKKIEESKKKNILYDEISISKREFSKEEIEIKSQIQSEENNILYAEGEVLVTYKGYILKADSLIYDKANKTIITTSQIKETI